MRRLKLTWIALGCGIIAASVETAFVGSVSPVVAQDDLKVIEVEPSHVEPFDKASEAEEIPSDAVEFENDKVDDKGLYLELAKQKAQLLTTEELAKATIVLRNELTELQAAVKLRAAELQLQKLIDEFPTSSAAVRARLMLRSGLQPIPAAGPSDRAVPYPIPSLDVVSPLSDQNSFLRSPREFLDDRLPEKKPPLRPTTDRDPEQRKQREFLEEAVPSRKRPTPAP